MSSLQVVFRGDWAHEHLLLADIVHFSSFLTHLLFSITSHASPLLEIAFQKPTSLSSSIQIFVTLTPNPPTLQPSNHNAHHPLPFHPRGPPPSTCRPRTPIWQRQQRRQRRRQPRRRQRAALDTMAASSAVSSTTMGNSSSMSSTMSSSMSSMTGSVSMSSSVSGMSTPSILYSEFSKTPPREKLMLVGLMLICVFFRSGVK